MTINAKGEMNVKTGLSNNGSFVSPECRKTLSQLTTITPTQLMTINTKWGGGGEHQDRTVNNKLQWLICFPRCHKTLF